MRFSDLLDSDRIVKMAFKFFCGLLALMLTPTLLANLLAAAHVSDATWLMLLCAASPIAYLVREHRRDRPLVRRTIRGAERTPILPPQGGEP